MFRFRTKKYEFNQLNRALQIKKHVIEIINNLINTTYPISSALGTKI